MKHATALIILWVLTVLVLVSLGAGATTPVDKTASDAAAIHRFFADALLVVEGLKSLLEPIGALLLAGGLVLQGFILRNQKKATAERVEQKAILVAQTDTLHAQNNTLATIQTTVATTVPPAGASTVVINNAGPETQS